MDACQEDRRSWLVNFAGVGVPAKSDASFIAHRKDHSENCGSQSSLLKLCLYGRGERGLGWLWRLYCRSTRFSFTFLCVHIQQCLRFAELRPFTV
jgi:hypothetical protein